MDQTASTPAAGQAVNPFQPGAQPSGQQPEGTQGGQGAEYVTKAEVNALRDEILRSAQSLVDKSNARIETKVKEIREQMGGQLTPEQEATLRANLAKSEQPASSPAPAPAQPAQATPAQAQVDPTLLTAQRVMAKAGVTIEETDPEFKSIAPFIGNDGEVDDPSGLLGALQSAIAAKRVRVASRENPVARVPMGGTNQPGGRPAMTPREKLAEGLKSK